MKPKIITNNQEELFRSRLSNQLNPEHELLKLSEMIPWSTLEEEFSDLFEKTAAVGRPATSIRLIIGLLLLQHMHNLSDRGVVQM